MNEWRSGDFSIQTRCIPLEAFASKNCTATTAQVSKPNVNINNKLICLLQTNMDKVFRKVLTFIYKQYVTEICPISHVSFRRKLLSSWYIVYLGQEKNYLFPIHQLNLSSYSKADHILFFFTFETLMKLKFHENLSKENIIIIVVLN